MQLKANSGYRQLKAWCIAQRVAASKIRGQYYRVVGPRHTTAAAIVSGIGGLKANGRWCRRGTSRLLYLSEIPETAMAESNEHARHNKLPLWKQMPKVVVAVEIDSNRILDLMDPAVSSTLPFDLPSLMNTDWRADNAGGRESLPQALGRAALAAGFDGLRVPSKPDRDGRNLVIFRPSRGGARVTLLDPDALENLGRV